MTNQNSRPKIIPRFSFTQIVASALAAGSAALAARYLGLVGTVVGAAIIGAIATTATTVYEHSLRRTNAALHRAASRSARRVEGLAATIPVLSPTSKALVRLTDRGAPEKPETTLHSGVEWAAGEHIKRPGRSASSVVSAETSMFSRVVTPAPRKPMPTVTRWKLAAGLTTAVLVTSMTTVAGLQLAGGSSLSDLMHGSSNDSGSSKGRVTVEQPIIVQNTSNRPTVRVTVGPSPSPTQPSSTQPTTPTPSQPTPSTPAPSAPPSGPNESSAPIIPQLR
ncbi:MAG TPA: hypothetical protein VHU91_01830 [Mycobacteriales bacterium]|jgi:hypothetical protein|nr:hypothetical protein [Mycobacteriales bacterium]